MNKIYSTNELAKQFNCTTSTVMNHSRKLFKGKNKLGVCTYFNKSEIDILRKSIVREKHKIIKDYGDFLIIDIAGYEIIIDKDILDRVLEYRWTVDKTTNNCIYFRRNEYDNYKVKKIYLHRFIMNAAKGTLIDHINKNTLDNRKCNLRLCTKAENGWNRGKTALNTSGYKGVSRDKSNKKWGAYITKNKKRYILGYFDTPELAYKAYCRAAKILHKEFANVG